MARYSGSFTSVTTGAGQADTTAMTSDTYVGLPGVAAARLSVYEIYMGGESAASAPAVMVFARSSTIATTPAASKARTAVLDGSGQGAAAAPTVYTSAAAGPQRSSTLHLLHISFNAYGGIVRWVAAPGSELQMYGTAATAGDSSLSPFTGTTSAIISGHILFEAA